MDDESIFTRLHSSRRAFLVSTGAVATAIAGCLGAGDDDSGTGEGNGDDDASGDDNGDDQSGTDDNGADDSNGTDDSNGAGDTEPTFTVTLTDIPETRFADEELSVVYEVENSGEAAGTQDVRFTLDGDELDRTELTLESGEITSGEFTAFTDTTFTDQLEQSVSVAVETEDDWDSQSMLVVHAPRAGGIDDIAAWNRTLLNVIRTTSETPTETVRRIAILTTAMYDAVTTIDATRNGGQYEPYGTYTDAPAGDASALAALGGAANAALSRMYPGFGQTFDRRLAGTLARASALDDGEIEAGEQWGRTVGEQAVAMREDDGYDEPESGGYDPCPGEVPEETPGCWRGGSIGTWRDSHYAFLDTWVLDEPLTFEGPPPLDSEAYAEAWQEVYELGDRNRDGRPDEHDDIATYWRGGAGTARPSGRWLRITNKAIESGEFDLSLLAASRLTALVGLALGDAGVSSWNGKHEYGYWRPREAIRAGDTDGNPETFVDPEWQPIAIGSSPEYPAALACYGATAKTIIVEVLGTDEFAFEMRSSGPPAQTRSFDSFGEALEESWMSRLYVGNHFRFALEDGLDAGEEIGEIVLERELRPIE